MYVPRDHLTTDIFSKTLGLDKLRKFSGALGLQHLDVPNLRGRADRKHHESEQERSGSDREAEMDEEFDFGLAGEAEGSNQNEKAGAIRSRGR